MKTYLATVMFITLIAAKSQATTWVTFPQMAIFEACVGEQSEKQSPGEDGDLLISTDGAFFEHRRQFHLTLSLYIGSSVESHEFWVFTYNPKEEKYLAYQFAGMIDQPKPSVYEGSWDEETKALELKSVGEPRRFSGSHLKGIKWKRGDLKFQFGKPKSG